MTAQYQPLAIGGWNEIMDLEILRPFVWMRFPNVSEPFYIHYEEPEGRDTRFRYLTGFEFTMGSEMEAKFTLVDTDDYLSGTLFQEFLKTGAKSRENGAIAQEEYSNLWAVDFNYGWYDYKASKTITKGRSDDEDDFFRGILQDITLNFGEGFYEYVFTVKGCLPFMEMNLPNKEGSAPETKLLRRKNTSVKDIIDRLCEGKYRVRYTDHARKYLEASRLRNDFNVSQSTILENVNRAFSLVHNRPNGETFICVDHPTERNTLTIHLVSSKEEEWKNAPIVRDYLIGLDRTPSNAVISFSPSVDKLFVRGQRTVAQSESPSGKSSQTTPQESAVSSDSDVTPSTASTRQSGDRTTDPSEQAANVEASTASNKGANVGWQATLTVIGDPRLVYIASEGSSVGKMVRLLVEKPRYVDGDNPVEGLSWSRLLYSRLLSGKYIIMDISHSMGDGTPYTTTLSLKMMQPGTFLNEGASGKPILQSVEGGKMDEIHKSNPQGAN